MVVIKFVYVSFQKRAVGWVLFERVCEGLNILEKDYFGLRYTDPSGLKVNVQSA